MTTAPITFSFRSAARIAKFEFPLHERSPSMAEGLRAAKPSVFRVMLGESGWTVREDGGATTYCTSRAEAVREAQRVAQTRDVARVFLHYADSTVERQILFHGEPRAARTWRATDVQPSGGRS